MCRMHETLFRTRHFRIHNKCSQCCFNDFRHSRSPDRCVWVYLHFSLFRNPHNTLTLCLSLQRVIVCMFACVWFDWILDFPELNESFNSHDVMNIIKYWLDVYCCCCSFDMNSVVILNHSSINQVVCSSVHSTHSWSIVIIFRHEQCADKFSDV